VIGLVITLAVQVSIADDFNQEQAEVRELLTKGEILPLNDILRDIQSGFPDRRLLKVKLETKADRLIYELEFVDSGGEVVEIEVDAGSGQILKQKIEQD